MNPKENARLNRERLQSIIEERPGVHLRELQRELAISSRQTVNALSILETEGKVFSDYDGYMKHFFPISMKKEEKCVTLNPSDRKIADHIQANPGVDTSELSAHFHLTRQTILYHTNKLQEMDIVRFIVDDAKFYYYRTRRKYL